MEQNDIWFSYSTTKKKLITSSNLDKNFGLHNYKNGNITRHAMVIYKEIFKKHFGINDVQEIV